MRRTILLATALVLGCYSTSPATDDTFEDAGMRATAEETGGATDEPGDTATEALFRLEVRALEGWEVGVTETDWQEVSEMAKSVDTLALDGPIITEQDITGYDWGQHILFLTETASAQLEETGISYELRQPVPAVVVLDGERIYFTVFWPPFWSSIPSCPWWLYYPIVDASSPQIYIGPKEDEGVNDPRIHDFLEAEGLLIEER